MPRIIFIEANGRRIETTAKEGQSLMQAAVQAGIAAIAAECGGACACATCHCHIEPDWSTRLQPAGANETDMLDYVIDPGEHSRLSCQIEITGEMDGLVVFVPASQI